MFDEIFYIYSTYPIWGYLLFAADLGVIHTLGVMQEAFKTALKSKMLTFLKISNYGFENLREDIALILSQNNIVDALHHASGKIMLIIKNIFDGSLQDSPCTHRCKIVSLPPLPGIWLNTSLQNA